MMKAKLTLLSFAILLHYTLCAQVTIGNTEKPEAGALLQLKNINGVTNGGANANKGLGISRVHLSNPNSLKPIVENASDLDKKAHTGLLVYASEDFGRYPTYCPGLYVWDEASWTPLDDNTRGKDAASELTITDADNNTYSYKKYGNTYWMLSNLRTTKKANGTNIATTAAPLYINPAKRSNSLTATDKTPPITILSQADIDNSTQEIKYQENNIEVSYTYSEFTNIFGLLYTRAQAMEACPQGWRMPTLTDLKELAQALDAPYKNQPPVGATNPNTIAYIENSKVFKGNDWDYTPSDKTEIYNWGGYSICSNKNSGIHFLPTGYVPTSVAPDARQFGRETHIGLSDMDAQNYKYYFSMNAETDIITINKAATGPTNYFYFPIRCVKDAQ